MRDFTDVIASEGVVLLPGTIHGLLRNDVAIVCTSGLYAGRWGVVLNMTRGASEAVVALRGREAVEPLGALEPIVATVELAHLALNLTYDSGRACAMQWAADAFNMGYGFHGNIIYAMWLWNMGEGRWSLRSPENHKFVTFRAPGSPEPSTSRPEIASLGELDPNDPRKLADMSRWVDAEALRRICLYTASELAR